MKYFTTIFLLLYSLTTALHGQLNIGVGFSVLFPDFGEIDRINQEFNMQNAQDLELPFSEISSMTGINLGLRYHFGSTGILFGFENADKDVNIVAVNPGTIDASERKYFYNSKTTSIGVENRVGRILYGGLVSRRTFKISADLNNTDVKRVLEEDKGLAVRIFAGYVISRGQYVSLELRPFYDWNLDNVDLTNYSQQLIGTTEPASFKPKSFGITLIFYNGGQY